MQLDLDVQILYICKLIVAKLHDTSENKFILCGFAVTQIQRELQLH